MNIDIDSILKKIQSSTQKEEGLDEMANALAAGCSTATFLGNLEKMFSGLRSCLQFDQNQADIIMKANQVLLDMLPDIQHSDDLEVQFAQLMPVFIDNLGNSKAVVRKSTHKCIATYVKISKKLEFVLLHLIHTGLESSCTRTRQHSMLVVPALISLKPSVVDRCTPEITELISRIIKRLRDPLEIVAKTARKLLLELQKCYPSQFENQLVPSLKNEEDRVICKAILRNDEDEIQRLLTHVSSQQSAAMNNPASRRGGQEDQKSQQNNGYSSATGGAGGLGGSKGSTYGAPGATKELSIIGKEILSNNPHQHMFSAQASQGGSMQMLDKIITEAKEESRYPKGQNGLYFGFLDESLIEALNENNQWKERTNSIEAIESQLYSILGSEKRVDFLPLATNFLSFMIQYIADINFKISLTTIKIISKLLQIPGINIKKYYSQLASSLIEKLSDSKVVIRQGVLKSCSILITNYKASTFAYFAMKYLSQQNWHVREGALNLVANCIIVQSQNTKGQQSSQQFVPQTPDQDIPLPLNAVMIQELCNQVQSEDKQKIQQQMIDVLSLMLERTTDKQKTTVMIGKALGLKTVPKSHDEVLNSSNQSREMSYLKQIVERFQRGNLPFINEESIVDFPAYSSQPSMSLNKSGIGLSQQQQQSFNNLDESEFQTPQASSSNQSQQETFASNLNKLPSQGFMDMKKKQQILLQQQEEEKKSLSRSEPTTKDQQVLGGGPPDGDKISMWLPSFPIAGPQQPGQMSSQKNIGQGTPLQSNKNPRNSQKVENNLNAASSSGAATFIEDGKSMQSYQNQMPFTEQKISHDNSHFVGSQSYGKSPLYSDGKIYSSMGPASSLSTNMPSNSTFSSSNMGGAQGSNLAQGMSIGQNRLGYTPESHASKPRNISSNEIRQRTMDGSIPQYGYNANDTTGNYPNQELNYDISLNMQKNMSHSSGGSGGFGMNSNGKGPLVNDRLKLLKQKQTTTSTVQSADKPRRDFLNQNYEEVDNIPTYVNNEAAIPSQRMEKVFPQNIINQRKLNIQGGPIKGNHLDENISSMQNDDQYSIEGSNASFTPNIVKTKKPPLTNKSASSVSKIQSRAQSVDTSINGAASPSSLPGDNAADMYIPKEEPLINPEKQLQQALDYLKSGDWQKQFEACNILKRVAMYHKALLSQSHPLQPQIIKELMKQVDNLRSQLAKNAMLTISTILDNIPARELDYMVDSFIPPLVKKAADTNAFLVDSADQALIAACSMLSDVRVFTCLQSQNMRSNSTKVKMAMCYNTLIDKLGPRIRQFKDMDRLIQAVANLLSEAAIEVRNMAKHGLLSLKNALGSQRELEAILIRCVPNEKQFEKIRQIIDKNDFDSISNTGSTRYGSSMRTSSLDSRSAGQFRGNNPQQAIASGSDGFGKFTQSSDFNIPQNTYTKGPTGIGSSVMTTTNGSQGFNTTANSNSFKKNNVVSKPVDPQVMEDFRQILAELGSSDWSKRIRSVDALSDFVNTYQTTIKQAQPAKFIQVIDAFCKIINDNNAKVLSHAQQAFRQILQNPNLQPLIEQNLTMIVQALTTNLSSTNAAAKDQGEFLLNLLEASVDPNLLVSPLTAQINLSNNRAKPQLIERLSSVIERVDKVNLIQKYVQPLLQQSNKIQSEASSNARLKEALQKLSQSTQRALSQIASPSMVPSAQNQGYQAN